MKWIWAVVWAVPFAAFVATLVPTPYGLDSPLLTTAAWLLGISHPPGHPLYEVLGKLVSFLPFGDIALRVTLLSTAAGACASLALFAVVRRCASQAIALTLTLAFAGSHAVWFQAIRAEVYTLHAALTLAVLWLLTGRVRPSRALLGAAFTAGLALGNHHYLVLVLLPGLAAFALARYGRAALPLRAWLRAGTFLALGLTIYLYLPLRAGFHPDIDWGRPNTAGNFAWTVSAQLFQKSATAPKGSLADGYAQAVDLMASDSHATLIALAALALGALILLRTHRALGIALTILAFGALFPKAQMGFASGNPDDHGYVMFALAALLVAVGVGFRAARERILPALRPGFAVLASRGAIAVLIASCALAVAENVGRNDGRLRRGADAIARAELRSLPEGAFLFSSYFKTEFALGYLQSVERARPDVTIVHRNALPLVGYADGLAHHTGPLRAFLEATIAGRDARKEATALADTRPFLWEIDLNIPSLFAPHLEPHAFFASWTAIPDALSLQAAARREAAFFARHTERLMADARHDREDIETLFWLHYLRGRFWAARGERAFAAAAFDRALAIDGANAEVLHERQALFSYK